MVPGRSQHILNTSSNLLGFCLVVLTSLKITNYNTITMIDEVTGVASIFLIASSVMSFLSLRANSDTAIQRLERYADFTFIIALFIVSAITIMIAFSIIF